MNIKEQKSEEPEKKFQLFGNYSKKAGIQALGIIGNHAEEVRLQGFAPINIAEEARLQTFGVLGNYAKKAGIQWLGLTNSAKKAGMQVLGLLGNYTKKAHTQAFGIIGNYAKKANIQFFGLPVNFALLCKKQTGLININISSERPSQTSIIYINKKGIGFGNNLYARIRKARENVKEHIKNPEDYEKNNKNSLLNKITFGKYHTIGDLENRMIKNYEKRKSPSPTN